MSKILLASWGDPSSWKKVTYIYENDNERKEICTFSSTLALAEILDIEYDNMVIFLATSLFTKTFDINKDIININFDYIKEKIKEYSCELIKKRHGDVNPKLVVVPSIGYFRSNNKNFVFEGSAETYLTSIYYYVLNELTRDNNENKMDIHLDITHGVNYMPLMCKEAVELAANTYAVTTGKKVQVNVYNSDPIFLQQDDCNVKLNINKIYEVTYDGHKSIVQLLLKFVLDYNINKNFYKNKLVNKLTSENITSENITRKDLEDLYKVSKAVSSGILLVLPYKYELIKSFKEKLDKLLERNSKDVKVEKKDCNNIVIKHERSLYRIALLHSVLKTLDSIQLLYYNEGEYIGISLKSLEENLKKYYKNTLDSVESIVSQEIDYLKEKYKDSIPTDNYQQYAMIKHDAMIKYGPNYQSRKGANRRVLYAHGGLEENVTLLKKTNDDILISYGDNINNVFNNI